MIKVLFVCLGNICRSPSAEGVFRHLVETHADGLLITTDSCGTAAYHVGNPPDERAQKVALGRGFDLSDLRARKVSQDDFVQFDYIIAMDFSNLSDLKSQCPSEYIDKISLFLDHAPTTKHQEVPDPYYGDISGYEDAFDLINLGATGLLEHIRSQHG